MSRSKICNNPKHFPFKDKMQYWSGLNCKLCAIEAKEQEAVEAAIPKCRRCENNGYLLGNDLCDECTYYLEELQKDIELINDYFK